jgi:TolB-like protein/DNA-binding winged helix-turn-helix (wHTH) protein/tetratricopeptide (TPR) repeat protein
MTRPAPNSQGIRFGVYEVDPRTGELRKHGIRVKLQDQPFAILMMLLERPGELVTREQIREKLWPADTFVDFDHSLNTAIRRLRDALCDSADSPRFIETLPRRGYRFLGEVQGGGSAGFAPAFQPPGTPAISVSATLRPAEAGPQTVEAPAVRRRSGAPVLALMALTLVVVGLIAWQMWPRSAIDSVAVLPFVNATNDVDLDYLSDGIAESVMANLSQVPTLKVMSRNSAFRYKGKTPDPGQVARELGVRAVLLGSMRQQGDRLRISLELVDAHDGRQLWGADFERPRGEVVQIEREISQQVSEKLRLRLTGEQQERLARRHIPPPKAYEFYLRGREALRTRTNAEIRRGLEFLQRAVDADPDYADAYVGMGNAYGLLVFWGGMDPKQAYPREEAAVWRAMQLAPNAASVHVLMAYFLDNARRDRPGAEREWKRAIEMEPNSADAHHGYSMFLGNTGRFDEALREAHLTEKLDPLWPGSRATTAGILLDARRYAEAERYALNVGAGFHPAGWVLERVYMHQGRYQEAIDTFREDMKHAGPGTYEEAMLAQVYAMAGKKKEARALLAEMLAVYKNSYFSPTNIAAVYVALGEQDAALNWLKIAEEQGDPRLGDLRVNPDFDPLRTLPEFQAIMKKAITSN